MGIEDRQTGFLNLVTHNSDTFFDEIRVDGPCYVCENAFGNAELALLHTSKLLRFPYQTLRTSNVSAFCEEFRACEDLYSVLIDVIAHNTFIDPACPKYSAFLQGLVVCPHYI